MAETKWIAIGLDMLPFSDFRYFVSVLKSFSVLPEVKHCGIESSAAFIGFIFWRQIFVCLFSEIVWEMILPCYLDKIKHVAGRRQRAKFVDMLQSLP